MDDTKSLSQKLQEAFDATGRRTDRDALPTVFDAYKLFVESGRFPYDAEVVKEIAIKYKLVSDTNRRFDHQAVCDAKDGVLIQLHTEVYLASTQYAVLKMQAEERKLVTEGFTPITQLVPQERMKIVLPDGVPYRLSQSGDDWVLLAPGKRTHGMTLNGLVQQQQAYEAAVVLGRTSNNGPVVRAFKPAKSPVRALDTVKPGAKSYPVIYAPATGNAHDKVKHPLGYASTPQGALKVASGALGRVPANERRLAVLQEYPDLDPDLSDNAGPVTAWTVSGQLITHVGRRTRTQSSVAPVAPAKPRVTRDRLRHPSFSLTGPELGGPFVAVWTITTLEGAAKKVIWNQEAHRTGEPALVVGERVNGTDYMRPLVGDRYAVGDGKRSTVQAIVERFVDDLNGIEPPEAFIPVAKADSSLEQRLF